jgi:transposase
MSRLRRRCSDARFAWNLCVEQEEEWRPGRGRMPRFAERCRQLTEARAENPWLIAVGPGDARRLNRNHAESKVPMAGWVRFRWSRPVPPDVRSFRVTRDRAGRWHVAFAAIPAPVPGPGTGEAVGVDRGVAASAALSTGEMLYCPGLSPREAARLRSLARRLEKKAPGRVEKVPPAYTSQRCSACGHVARESRESQALHRCIACGYACNADVNAARNIAAGHAVKARGGDGVSRPSNGEPQRTLLES